MNKVVNLGDKRNPTRYTVQIAHHWDGTVEAFVEDVSDSEQSQNAVWFALCQIAMKRMSIDQINGALLHKIDGLMGSENGEDVKLLSALASACELIEAQIIT